MNICFNESKHAYKLDGRSVPSVTQVLSCVGISDFRMVNDEVLTRSMNYGTAVHRMTELDDMGELDEDLLDTNLIPSLTAWRLFKEDHVKKFMSIEMKVASIIKGYAGTLDRIAETHKGEYWLIDIKTGTDSASQPIQTAAYESAYREMTGERKKITRVCVFLTAGKYNYSLVRHGDSVMDRTKHMNIFVNALSVHKYKMKGK